MIVDIGTAVTVDLLTSRGFEGGTIFPGARAILDSLHDKAAALPDVDYPLKRCEKAAIPGRSTSEAMASGMYWGMAGALEKLVGISVRASGSRPDIYLTGGNADGFKRNLEFPFIHEPDLVFKGLAGIFGNR